MRRMVVILGLVTSVMVNCERPDTKPQERVGTVRSAVVIDDQRANTFPTGTFFPKTALRYIAYAGTDNHFVNVIHSAVPAPGAQAVWSPPQVFGDDEVDGDGAVSIAHFNGKLYYAFNGTADQIIIRSSTDGVNWAKEVLANTETEYAPMLVSHGGRLVVAYTGTDGQLNVFSSPDGDFHGDANLDDKHVLGELTDHAPALASFNAKLYLGWTGTGAHNLNWEEVVGFGAGGARDHVVVAETSDDGEGLLGFGDKFILSWRGSGNSNINWAALSADQIATLTAQGGNVGLPAGTKVTVNDESDHTPTFARFGLSAALLWTGTDSDQHLNVEEDLFDWVMVCPDGSVSKADTDGDALLDCWETQGIDIEGDGIIDVDLLSMGADPRRKDLFLELDCVVATNHTHCPVSGAISDVVQAFANAPLTNPDGTRGVQLHVDVGPLYGVGARTSVSGNNGVVGNFGDFGGGGSQISEAGNTIIDWTGAAGSGATNFYGLKGANFNINRALAFRYVIFGHQTNARQPLNDCTSGWAEGTPSNDFLVVLGGTDGATPPNPCATVDANGFSVGSRAEQAGTLMHEFGHTLGLHHGGTVADASLESNFKPNYLSVMNYAFQDCTVTAVPAGGVPGGCDYSRFALPQLNETSLDECAGIGGGLGLGGVDWNGSGLPLQGATCPPPNNVNQTADVNNDGVCIIPGINGTLDSAPSGDDVVDNNNNVITDGPDRVCNTTAIPDDFQQAAVGSTPPQPNLLTGSNDWINLFFPFQTLKNFAPGVSSPVPDEPDPRSIREARQYLSLVTAPGISVTNTAPATILPGQTLTWSIEVKNSGRGPALQTTLTDTLPDGSVFPFDLSTVVVGASFTRSTQFNVPSNACPMDLINVAAATFIDMASFPSTVIASASTRVLDIVPPTLTLAVTPTKLWPPNHGLVTITAAITVSDNCDPNPTVKLVSVTSNEPDNGLGDGDTSSDIQGAAVGTDDRSVQLRAERSGTGRGRVYTLTYQARDASGNTTTKTATVSVPLSQ